MTSEMTTGIYETTTMEYYDDYENGTSYSSSEEENEVEEEREVMV